MPPQQNPVISAFAASPDRGRGLARDMRVRWAPEEVGQPYDVPLLSFAEMKQPAHLALQPFGQIPTWEQGGLVLFKTGAIILHLAQQRPGLLPDDSDARARAIAWMFAGLSTLEPPIVEREAACLLERDRPWFEERQRMMEARIRPAFRRAFAAQAAVFEAARSTEPPATEGETP